MMFGLMSNKEDKNNSEPDLPPMAAIPAIDMEDVAASYDKNDFGKSPT